jgi:SAM-dependent methyltransferase
MKIHFEELSDVTRYLKLYEGVGIDGKQATAENILRVVGKRVAITPQTKILEVGTGTGWFPLYCQRKGLDCSGIEISPRLVTYAAQLAHANGLQCNVELGNIEQVDLKTDHYDVIVCSSVFEHVENWRLGIANVYRALRPGGVMFFESTCKFSFTSAEYRFPLYGWLPNRLRYRLRIAMQGPDIMKLGIDFNQFTNGQLRREFAKAGFQEILDRIDLADGSHVAARWKRPLVRWSPHFPPLRLAMLTFSDVTRYLCVK